MIERVKLAARLTAFAAASWILVVVAWGLITGVKQIETPLFAVWVLIACFAAQLGLWLVSWLVQRQ